MKFFFSLIFYLLLSLPLMAQTGAITGTVTTADGQAAVAVHVQLPDIKKGTSTDKHGYFMLQDIPSGTHTLLFTPIGMQPQQLVVSVKAGETLQLAPVPLAETLSELEQVVITGTPTNQYTTNVPSRALRLQGPLVEAPQNIQVIPRQVLQDQQSLDMLESVSRNVSGVQMIEHWGNFARINMRGFKIPAFRNGMNVDLPWGPLTEDISMIDRIEFVKGPAGFMLSSGEPGGLYNVVTKKPDADAEQEVTVTAGSFNTLRSTLDLGGRLSSDGRLLYRLNAMGSTKGSHRDYEFNNRFTLAPSLRYQLSGKTSLTAEYIYQYSQMSVVGAAYVFSPKAYGDLPRNFTLAEPNIDPTHIREHNAFVSLDHALSNNWNLTAQLGYLHYEQVGSSLWPSSVEADGTIVRGLNIWDALNESKLGQLFLNGSVQTGAIGHKILAGVDLGHKDYYADWFQGGDFQGISPFNIYDPVHGVPSEALPGFDRSQSIRKRAYGSYAAIVGQRYSSLYLQDQLEFFKNRVRLTLAGRYTDYSGWSYGSTTTDAVFSPRAGLSITLAPNTSVYGLYDQSFIPQAGSTIEGELFVPVRANNLEAGLKRSWAEGRWNSTLTAYRITKTNVVVGHPDPEVLALNPHAQLQLGEVQSKGIEFDVQGEIVSGLQLILNYANTQVEITEDTNEDLIGTRVAGHARHMTNGWLKYSFQRNTLEGLGIALGYQYQLDRSSWSWGADNTSALPDYFRLDGALSWQQDKLRVGLNVNNLLNQYLYSGSAYGSYYYWQTEPGTNLRLQLGYKF
jgi:iron complex outermembrane receptor protein